MSEKRTECCKGCCPDCREARLVGPSGPVTNGEFYSALDELGIDEDDWRAELSFIESAIYKIIGARKALTAARLDAQIEVSECVRLRQVYEAARAEAAELRAEVSKMRSGQIDSSERWAAVTSRAIAAARLEGEIEALEWCAIHMDTRWDVDELLENRIAES